MMTTPTLRAWALLLTSCFTSCRISTQATEQEPEPVRVGPSYVTFLTADKDVTIKVEVADSDAERAQGLMNRKKLGDRHGMIFVFPTDAVQSFWMKNTLIPLDMIFVDADLRIVSIIKNAEPLTLTSRSSEVPCRYVVEVNGGFSEAHGIKVGAAIEIENVL